MIGKWNQWRPSFIQSHIPPIEGEDQVRWKLKKTGEFDIWSFNSVLRGHLIVTFPWKGIWGVKASWRVSFFCLDNGMGENTHWR